MSDTNKGSKIVTGVLWRFGEKVTAQMVSFMVSIVLARLLLPNDYGIVAIVNIFISIAEVFVTSGLGTALIQKKDADETDFSTVFWCNIALSICLYVIVFVLSPLIASFYNISSLTAVLRVFSLRLPISAINSIQNAYVSRKMDFKKFFFATLIGTIISAIVGIVMAYKGFGVWALVAQYLTNSTIDTIALFVIVNWRPQLKFSLKRAKPLVSYGWKVLATDLLGVIFNQLNALIIGKEYTSEDLAYYTQGKKIPDLINSNIGSTLCAVLFPAMSLSNDREEIKHIRRKSLKMIEYVMFPLMLGLIVVADKMILVLMTEKWMFAVPYVRITCLSAIIGTLGTTLIQEVKAIGRSDITLKMELIKKPIFLLIAIVAMKFGVMAVAWTLVIDEILAFCFNVYPVRKYIGFDFKLHLTDAMAPLVMSLIMALVVYSVGTLIPNILLSLIVQVVLGVGVYVVLSLLTKNESFIDLMRILPSKADNC